MNQEDENKTKFRHYRNLQYSGNPLDSFPDCRGGATIAYRKAPDGSYMVGVAYCHPNDNFSYANGRAKASGRLDQLEARGFDLNYLSEKYGGDKHMLVQAADERELIEHMDKLLVREAGYFHR